jgi:hypothetical protein
MTPLISAIANGTDQFWAAVTLFAVGAVHTPPPKKKRSPPAHLDRRTLKDIGVEPGSITWM